MELSAQRKSENNQFVGEAREKSPNEIGVVAFLLGVIEKTLPTKIRK